MALFTEKKKIAVIGASNIQKPIVLKANELGIETYVFAWEKGNAVNNIATEFFPISILEKEKILDKCKSLAINGIITVGSDLALDTVNYVADHLDLVGNSLYSTRITRDKHLMRERFHDAGLPVPQFYVLKDERDINRIELEYPFMIKATDRSGSRGIQLVYNNVEAYNAFRIAKDISLNKKVIAEEYFDGKQYSLEFISQGGKHQFVGLTEEFYTGPPHFVETGHLMPGRLSDDKLQKAIELTSKALDSMDFKNGASHTELRINDNNDYCFIEIAGRMGGDFRSELIRLAYEYDYITAAVKIALGEKLTLQDVPANSYAFIKWVINPKDMENFEILKTKHSMDTVELPSDFNYKDLVTSSSDRLGFYIGHSSTLPNDFIEIV